MHNAIELELNNENKPRDHAKSLRDSPESYFIRITHGALVGLVRMQEDRAVLSS